MRMGISTEIDVWHGDVAELEVDAIIVPASESLFMTTQAARAIKRVAGETVERDAVQQGPVPAGSVVVTGGGGLASAYVIHTVGVGHELMKDPQVLSAALDAALDAAGRLGLRRMAAVPVGSERSVFSPAEAAEIFMGVIAERAERGAVLPESLVLAAASPPEVAAYRAALEALGAGSR